VGIRASLPAVCGLVCVNEDAEEESDAAGVYVDPNVNGASLTRGVEVVRIVTPKDGGGRGKDVFLQSGVFLEELLKMPFTTFPLPDLNNLDMSFNGNFVLPFVLQ
jgi:hypothetical protein